MTQDKKISLKKRIIERNSLYELQGSRIKRLLKDPVRTFTFYVMQSVGYIRPYKVTHKTLWGQEMSYYLPEGGMVYYYGFWEANLTNFLINFLHEGDVFFDVGAHVGYYSLLASNLVGENGKVHSFEPTPRTFQSLKENATRTKNITVHNNAILDKETTIEFFDYGPKYSAFNTFKKRTGEEIFFKDNVNAISVKTISLDAFCNENELSPTFIKIDAEGSEYLILGAMSQLLREKHPILSMEVSTNKEWEENLTSSFKTLAEYGYEAYECTLDGKLRSCDPNEPRLYDNLIFAHPLSLHRLKDLVIV